MLGLGLAIALVLNDRIRGRRQYQAIVFLPYVLPATAIGLAFSFLLQENGVLNTALRDVHLGALAQDWLGNSHLAIVSVGGLVIWQQLGFGVVVFTAALLALPPETAEAARIDGAGWWALQLRVLVPQIRPIIELLTVIQVITVLSWVFNYVYILTSGGPGYASSVMELYIWRSFSNGADGTAASVAVMLLGMASVLIGLSLWVRAADGDDMRTTPARAHRRRAVAARVPRHHLPRGALSALVHRVDGAQDRTPPTSSTRPASRRTRRSARCARSRRPAAAPLDVEQLPGHRLRRSPRRR